MGARSTIIVGAGLAGLVAAVTLRDAGHEVIVLDAGDHPGGTSTLSSGWIWRYRTAALASWGAPGGDPDLLQLLHDRWRDDVTWLEQQTGAIIEARGTSPHTDAVRIEPAAAIDALAAPLGERIVTQARMVDITPLAAGTDRWRVRCGDGRSWDAPSVVLATGGGAGDLAAVGSMLGADRASQSWWTVRSRGLSRGDTARVGRRHEWRRVRHAAPLTYARAVPTGVEVQAEAWGPTAQVHGAVGMLIDARGCAVPRRGYDWADTVLMNELAVRGGRGWFLLDAAAASRPGVAERIAAARALGADVFDVPCGGMTAVLAEHAGLRCDARAHASAREAVVVVGVRVGITHTTGGLLPDTQGRVIDAAGRPVPGMHVAGVDAGGLAGRGYVSGLAQALVLGRAAADSIIG